MSKILKALTIFTLCALIITPTAHAQELPDTLALTKHQRWFIPDFGTLQYAGSIGMFSLGAGYNIIHKKAKLEALFGIVPGIANLETATLKFTGHTVNIRHSENLTIHALNAGIYLNYAFGREFSSDLPGWYPSGYYWWSEAVRVNIFIGGDVSYTPPRLKGIRRLDLYYELGTNELKLVSYAQNTGYLSIWQILHAGIGVRAHFHK